jgi:hypothetical protein
MIRSNAGPLILVVAGILMLLSVVSYLVTDAERQASQLDAGRQTLEAMRPR